MLVTVRYDPRVMQRPTDTRARLRRALLSVQLPSQSLHPSVDPVGWPGKNYWLQRNCFSSISILSFTTWLCFLQVTNVTFNQADLSALTRRSSARCSCYTPAVEGQQPCNGPEPPDSLTDLCLISFSSLIASKERSSILIWNSSRFFGL
jgi:hypothetical protein